jgi:energy-coupling factor transport system permease protein
MNSQSFIINIIPGKQLLHKLNGTTKVALFIVLIVYIIMSFDLRLLLPLFILGGIALVSLKPYWKPIIAVFITILLLNLLNIFLFWLVNPAIGSTMTGGSQTILIQFNSHYFISLETLWYLSVRLLKLLTSFLISIVFIQAITPAQLAAGLSGLGFPYKMSTVVSLAFRYLPDIARDYMNIKVAMQARGAELDAKRLNLMERIKQNTYILLPLIVSSFDRVGLVANALDLRGFGLGKKRTYYCETKSTLMDYIFRTLTVLILVFIIYWIGSRIIHPPQSSMWFPFEV